MKRHLWIMLCVTLVLALGLALATPVFAQEGEAPARGIVSVDEVVRRALDFNYDLRSARENIEAAAGRKDQTLQRYLPSLNAGLDYRRSFGPVDLIAFLDVINVYGGPGGGSQEFDPRRGVIVKDDGDALPIFGLVLESSW